MKDIPKRYNPSEYEEKWASLWVSEKTFASKPDSSKPYSIVIPPPNVTGVLHMGHALNNVLQDIIIRVHKIATLNKELIELKIGEINIKIKEIVKGKIIKLVE